MALNYTNKILKKTWKRFFFRGHTCHVSLNIILLHENINTIENRKIKGLRFTF